MLAVSGGSLSVCLKHNIGLNLVIIVGVFPATPATLQSRLCVRRCLVGGDLSFTMAVKPLHQARKSFDYGN